MNKSWIVELEPNRVWLAPWSGDPGRTIVKKNAKKYSEKGAKIAIGKVQKYYPYYPDATIKQVES